MCGLFGVIRPIGVHREDEALLDAIGERLLHRGPDGSGYIRERGALLGMHRLSIMDPSHGWQPFWSEDSRFGVLGNGEIYNAASLRTQLVGRGHTLHTGSDMEVVPHLLEEYGEGAFTKLRGMFALLVIDRVANQVLIVRDRLGEKPICYAEVDGAIVLSSEQSALIRSGAIAPRINGAMLGPYLLHGYTPEPLSLVEGIAKVPAAHILRISLTNGALTLERYWDSRDYIADNRLSTADLTTAIEDAVVAACESDVPVGLALSGGLDSSLVAAIATRARTDLRAFTIGYSETGWDESSLAVGLAEHLAIPCQVTILRTDEIARGFADICAFRDEPISDIAGPALAAVPRTARAADVPVLLTGIGGDELFWGYEWIRNLAAWTTTALAEQAAGIASSRPRFTKRPTNLQGMVDWGFALGGARTNAEMHSFIDQRNTDGLMPLPFYEFQPGYRTIRRAMVELLGSGSLRPEFWVSPMADEMGAQYTWASNETYLRVNSFVQVDRLAMHYSIESRTPLADADLIQTIMSTRLGSEDHFGSPKARMREVARAYLPSDVIDRPKRGFTPPVRDWIRAIWRENSQVLDASACIDMAGLPPKATTAWLRSPVYRTGRVNQVALRLLTLELWLRSLR